jgi:transitional endoplasmic reticulum ATPase
VSVMETLELLPLGDPDAFQDEVLVCQDMKLGEFLRKAPAFSLRALDARLLERPLKRLRIQAVARDPSLPLHWPPGVELPVNGARPEPNPPPKAGPPLPPARRFAPPSAALSTDGHPEARTEDQAVELAYGDEIESIASFLRAGLSVLVMCDKLVVRHLWPPIVSAARLDHLVLDVPPDNGEGGLVPRSLRQRQLAQLRELITNVKEGQVLVLPHLDLLAGGGERGMTSEAREITELLYEAPDRPLLAFVDRSLPVPEVIAARFAVRPELSGLPRDIPVDVTHRAPLGVALVTQRERAMFVGYKPAELFKQVAGMNPVRLRHALAYAVQIEAGRGHSPEKPAPVSRLYESIRIFKAQTSEQFVIPDVTMADIGGYDQVKAVLARALGLMAGAWSLPDEGLRRELIPRGFLLWGPPGTGKTLFAKAIANQLNATIRVVSGPEVTDMYVGESERKLRAVFAEARRNAPSVIVFDEFDSIAAKRSGRDDGGSRAGNALVAQILTEMDGFRPDVPMLVIGTTNRLNLIDEALLRPSRFQPIAIGLPDQAARRRIAEVHAGHFRVDVSPELLDAIADASYGFNGDQIRSLFRDACVGMHCDSPPAPPTPERLGFLVGRVRAAADEQRLEVDERRATGAAQPAMVIGPRRRPLSPMFVISPPSSSPAAADGASQGDAS